MFRVRLLAVAAIGIGFSPQACHAADRAGEGDPRATPAGVVAAQMEALCEWRANEAAAGRVFALASPSNRAVTGPLPAFRAMVETPPFDALLDNDGWVAGRPVESQGVAAVLVTLVDPRGGTRAFRFYLSRQEGGGWATDAVFPVTALPSAVRPPTAADGAPPGAADPADQPDPDTQGDRGV